MFNKIRSYRYNHAILIIENSITDEGFKKIIRSLITIPSFDKICITGNNITSDGYVYFVQKNIEHFVSFNIDESIYNIIILLDGFIPEWRRFIKMLVSDNPIESLEGITALEVCLNDDIQRSFFCWLGGIILLIKNLASNLVFDVIPAIFILNNISSSGIYKTFI